MNVPPGITDPDVIRRFTEPITTKQALAEMADLLLLICDDVRFPITVDKQLLLMRIGQGEVVDAD